MYLFCLIDTAELSTHCVHNSTISIPATRFGYYIAVISECNATNYLKYVKMDTGEGKGKVKGKGKKVKVKR